MREVPDKIAGRIRRMAKRIAWFHYWTGDRFEMEMDLEQEGLIGCMTSDIPWTKTRELNSYLRQCMVNYLLRWLYGVQNRKSESLKTLTISVEDQPDSGAWADYFTDPGPSPEECVYVNQVIDVVVNQLAPKCRVIKLSDYKNMIRAMVENSDPYLTESAAKDLKKLSRSTTAWMKHQVQDAFRETLELRKAA